MRPHPDLDLLALHALGEPVLDDGARQHVAGCSRCTATVADLGATVRTVRGPSTEDARAVPVPAHVWQGISSELGLDPSVRPASVGPSSLRRQQVGAQGTAGRAAEAPTGGAAAVRPPAAGPAPADPGATSLAAVRRRRASGPLRLLAVAAAGLAVGAAGTALVVPRLADEAPAEPVVLAAADLEAFGAGEGTDVSGSARLAVAADAPAAAGPADDRVLQVWLDELPDGGDGFLEAWLIDPETGAMVSLGPVRTDGPGQVTAELAVPRGLDVDAYDLVDVSAEPLDGDPTHSGVSLVRGTLGT